MYLFVTFMEQKQQYYEAGPSVARTKARLEAASGERCLIVPYEEMSVALVEELSARAVVMSGFGGKLQHRSIRSFYGIEEVLRLCELPMLWICGSHQLIGHLWGRDIRRIKGLRDLPMRRIRKDEDWPREPCTDPKTDLSGYFIARGYFPVRRLKSDPLFAGLPKTMIMRCSHYCEIKKLPKDFELIASSDHCRIEAMRHRTRTLYGVQFHPETYERPFHDGRKLLENFAGIVDRFWKGASPRR